MAASTPCRQARWKHYPHPGAAQGSVAQANLLEAAASQVAVGEVQLLATGIEHQLVGLRQQLEHVAIDDLQAYDACLATGQLPVERGLRINDPDTIQRRSIIREIMRRFTVSIDPVNDANEWQAPQELEADGPV